MVWTLVCSGRSGDSGHPWGVQILDGYLFFGIENSGMPRAIGLQFVGVKLRKPRSETQYCGDQL
jgi:hypothetical protein